MRVAVGVHVSTYDVTASLVDTMLPELGPIASRTVTVAATPGGIGGAVATALGFIRVQARQNGLKVVGAAVVCENALQREIVADALADSEDGAIPVVDIFDERLSDVHTPDVSAALLVDDAKVVAAPALRVEHRGIWPVAAVGACVLAALGGVTAWAMTAESFPSSDEPPAAEMAVPTTIPGASSSVVRTTVTATPSVEPPPEIGPEVVPDVDQIFIEPYVPKAATPVESASESAPSRPTRSTAAAPPRTTTPSHNSGGGAGPTDPGPEPEPEPEPEPPTSSPITTTSTSAAPEVPAVEPPSTE